MYFDKIFPSACKYITRSKYSSLHEYTRSHSCFLARVSISKMFVKLFYIESLLKCNKRETIARVKWKWKNSIINNYSKSAGGVIKLHLFGT